MLRLVDAVGRPSWLALETELVGNVVGGWARIAVDRATTRLTVSVVVGGWARTAVGRAIVRLAASDVVGGWA